MLKLRNVRYVPKLKRNLISVDQLVNGGMKITFDDDVCKITKGTMLIAHSKKEDTLYVGFRSINFSFFIGVGSLSVPSKTWTYGREGTLQRWIPEWHHEHSGTAGCGGDGVHRTS